jgi:Carboxypeptidase regulatory-like domain
MSAVFSGFVRACVRLTTLSLVIALGAWGQGTGEITGTVTDATAAAINGAKIRVINAATAAERAVTTNDAGNYDVPALVLGIYDLKTEFRGFRTSERKGVELQVAQVARLDFSWQLGNVSDTVEVTGGAPVLETENATIGTVIESTYCRSAADRTQPAATCFSHSGRHHQRTCIVSGPAADGSCSQCLLAEGSRRRTAPGTLPIRAQ